MNIKFWSSTEYSGFLEGLMRELSAGGSNARQCFTISEAGYRSAKSTPARLWLRFRQYVVYPLQLCGALFAQRVKGGGGRVEGDCIVVSTNTFYAPLLATYLHPNVVHLVYDLFPEAMIHSGKWQEGTLKVRIVRWMTRQTLQRAAMNVFLGERLKDYVESIHAAVPNAAIIAVGADQSLFRLSPKQRLECCGSGVGSAAPFCAEPGGDLPRGSSSSIPASNSHSTESSPTILYCGNFGNMHDSATLFAYWREPAAGVADGAPGRAPLPDGVRSAVALPVGGAGDGGITWRFHCSGPKRAALIAARAALPDALKNQIQIGEGLDPRAWIEVMERADVALVTMVPGSETVVMPSKTYSAMMAGQAILAIAPEDSDLVDLIKAAHCGWWVAPGDVAGLGAAIEAIAQNPLELMEKREHAFKYAHEHLGQDALAQEWRRVLLRSSLKVEGLKD